MIEIKEKDCSNCAWYEHELFNCQGEEKICHEYSLNKHEYMLIEKEKNENDGK